MIPEYQEYLAAEAREIRRYRIVVVSMAVLSWAGLILVIATGAAPAHTIDTGVVYPPSCCHSAATHANGDCAPISSANVVARPDGYHVTLAAGQHPKLKTKGYSAVIPYSLARHLPVDDGQFHICLAADGVARFCFFAPGQGS